MAVSVKSLAGGAVLFALLCAGEGRAAGVTFTKVPSADNYVSSYPAKAAAEGMGGVANIDCQAAADGSLGDCKVVSETPAGYGFGEAALGLATKIRLSLPAGASREVAIPLRFVPPPRQVEAVFQGDKGPGPYFPERASRAHATGEARLECQLSGDGALKDCRVIGESPDKLGFGDAALKMAEKKWLTAVPKTVDGKPMAKETVRVVVPFRL